MTDEVIAGNEYDNINAEPGRESVKKAEFEPFGGEHGGENRKATIT